MQLPLLQRSEILGTLAFDVGQPGVALADAELISDTHQELTGCYGFKCRNIDA